MALPDDIFIRTITKPSIALDELVSIDRTRDGEFTEFQTFDVDSKQTGFYRPFIVINGFRVDPGLESFTLDVNGFLPVCTFNFTMNDPLFLSASYPKDGDIFSLYIRSVGEVYKPIRMDFNILKVQGNPLPSNSVGNSDGRYQRFTVLGECRIPGLYTNRNKAFRGKTSYETLLAITQDLELGFSSNDKSVNDEMTWICPGFNYYDFIKQVTDRSYKDDYSYFDSWIDPYYNLNFVNMGNQFAKEDMEVDTVMAAVSGGTPVDLADDTGLPGLDMALKEIPLVLTNDESTVGSPIYITGYTLLTDAGNHTNQSGYITTLQFYDSKTQEGEEENGYIKYDIESITTDEVGEALLQKGRGNESIYKDEKRTIWMGENKSGDSSSTHDNYKHAKVQNEINLLDSMKFNLKVEFRKFLPFIYRGQVVPVAIYVKQKGRRKANAGEGTTKNDGATVPDLFLSGLYVVSGYEVKYNKSIGKMTHSVNLRKKTWRINTAGEFAKAYPVDLGVGDI